MPDFVVIRLSSLGDIIHTLPAFAALRRTFPDSRITWVVQGAGREILELVPGLDRIIEIDPKSWKPFSSRFRDDLREIRGGSARRDQVAIDFQGLLKSGLTARLSGAKKRIGFHRANLREPSAALFYNQQIPEISDNPHVIRKNLRLLEALNIHEQTLEFPLVLPDTVQNGVRTMLDNLGFDSETRPVLLNVGAAWETKRWSETGWSDVAKQLSRSGYSPLLLWGTDLERRLAEAVSNTAGVPVVPRLGIVEVLSLLRESRLVVSGDTFAMQAACALGRPVVALFGPTTPQRNGPFDPRDRVVHHEMSCSHCYRRTCPDMTCITRITPDEVIDRCLSRMETDE